MEGTASITGPETVLCLSRVHVASESSYDDMAGSWAFESRVRRIAGGRGA